MKLYRSRVRALALWCVEQVIDLGVACRSRIDTVRRCEYRRACDESGAERAKYGDCARLASLGCDDFCGGSFAPNLFDGFAHDYANSRNLFNRRIA